MCVWAWEIIFLLESRIQPSMHWHQNHRYTRYWMILPNKLLYKCINWSHLRCYSSIKYIRTGYQYSFELGRTNLQKFNSVNREKFTSVIIVRQTNTEWIRYPSTSLPYTEGNILKLAQFIGLQFDPMAGGVESLFNSIWRWKFVQFFIKQNVAWIEQKFVQAPTFLKYSYEKQKYNWRHADLPRKK